MRSKEGRQSKLRRYIAAPKRFLAKARDFYVKSMIEFDGRVVYGSNMMMAMPAPRVSHMPKYFGASLKNAMKNDENWKELHRLMNSKTNEDNNSDKGGLCQRNSKVDAFDDLFRCYSVSVGRMGRIDEDEPCFFREEEIIMKSEILIPSGRR